MVVKGFWAVWRWLVVGAVVGVLMTADSLGSRWKRKCQRSSVHSLYLVGDVTITTLGPREMAG